LDRLIAIACHGESGQVGGGLLVDDPLLCVEAWIVPCIPAGENNHDSGQGSCIAGGLVFCLLKCAGMHQCQMPPG
jgi:hypothetical protein